MEYFEFCGTSESKNSESMHKRLTNAGAETESAYGTPLSNLERLSTVSGKSPSKALHIRAVSAACSGLEIRNPRRETPLPSVAPAVWNMTEMPENEAIAAAATGPAYPRSPPHAAHPAVTSKNPAVSAAGIPPPPRSSDVSGSASPASAENITMNAHMLKAAPAAEDTLCTAQAESEGYAGHGASPVCRPFAKSAPAIPITSADAIWDASRTRPVAVEPNIPVPTAETRNGGPAFTQNVSIRPAVSLSSRPFLTAAETHFAAEGYPPIAAASRMEPQDFGRRSSRVRGDIILPSVSEAGLSQRNMDSAMNGKSVGTTSPEQRERPALAPSAIGPARSSMTMPAKAPANAEDSETNLRLLKKITVPINIWGRGDGSVCPMRGKTAALLRVFIRRHFTAVAGPRIGK
mgnify:CR=1 FL=1